MLIQICNGSKWEVSRIQKGECNRIQAINQIMKKTWKNSLEGINSRITEAEERISDLEDQIVEITTAEQNKEKKWKELRTVSETSGITLNAPTFEL